MRISNETSMTIIMSPKLPKNTVHCTGLTAHILCTNVSDINAHKDFFGQIKLNEMFVEHNTKNSV